MIRVPLMESSASKEVVSKILVILKAIVMSHLYALTAFVFATLHIITTPRPSLAVSNHLMLQTPIKHS